MILICEWMEKGRFCGLNNLCFELKANIALDCDDRYIDSKAPIYSNLVILVVYVYINMYLIQNTLIYLWVAINVMTRRQYSIKFERIIKRHTHYTLVDRHVYFHPSRNMIRCDNLNRILGIYSRLYHVVTRG